MVPARKPVYQKTRAGDTPALVCFLCVVFAEAHQHGRCFGAGRLPLRVQIRTVALDNAIAARPLHRGHGVLGNIKRIGVFPFASITVTSTGQRIVMTLF